MGPTTEEEEEEVDAKMEEEEVVEANTEEEDVVAETEEEVVAGLGPGGKETTTGVFFIALGGSVA